MSNKFQITNGKKLLNFDIGHWSLIIRKAERWTFLLFLFSIPFQTRVFLYSAGATDGFNEWQSVFLYGTDLLVLALFGFWAFRKLKAKKESKPKPPNQSPNGSGSGLRPSSIERFVLQSQSRESPKPERSEWFGALNPILFFLGFFILFSASTVFFALYKDIALFRFVKLLEFVFVFFYTADILKFIPKTRAALAFAGGGILQATIAIGQFLKQDDLGLKILGESPLRAGSTQTAEIVTQTGRFVRGYGTLPSPNALAAFLALSVFMFLYWYLSEKRDISFKGVSIKFAGALLGLVLLGLGLLFSFSRAAIGAFGVVFVLYILFILTRDNLKEHRNKIKKIIVYITGSAVPFLVLFWKEIYGRIFVNTFEMHDLAIHKRAFLNDIAFKIIPSNILGVGPGNFTLYFREVFGGLREEIYQPVHSIYLLLVAENGLISAVLFVCFLVTLLIFGFKKRDSIGAATFSFAVLFVAGAGFFDHFFITLQQGGLMMWTVLGMLYYFILIDNNTLRGKPQS